MCTTITADRKFNFKNRTRECTLCEKGQKVSHIKTCICCQGRRKILINKRNYKCKACSGAGYTHLDKPDILGTCDRCEGTGLVPMTAYDWMNEEEKEWIFQNLFNFDKSYDKKYSEFNEGYLGDGLVTGITDYGRYKLMTPDQFKKEVHDTFMRHSGQYVSIIDKTTGKLPKEILIRKGETGWFAYPIYEKEN